MRISDWSSDVCSSDLFIASDRLDDVKARIIADPARLEAILDAANETPSASAISELRADIDRLFASDRYEDILAALRADGGEWEEKKLGQLAATSPHRTQVPLPQWAQGPATTHF